MVEKVYVERHDMKKKRFVWISIIALVLILALLIIYKFIYKSGVGAISKEDDVTATWSVEKYVENTEESDVKTNAKKIDKDPDSITVLVNKENSIDKDYKPDDLVEPNIKFSFN